MSETINENCMNNQEIDLKSKRPVSKKQFYAIEIKGIDAKNNYFLNGIHHNWTLLLPSERTFDIFSHCRSSNASNFDKVGINLISETQAIVCGIIEFEPNIVPKKGTERIFPDLIGCKSMELDRCKLKCTDIKQIRRGTKVEMTIDFKTKQVVSIRGPNQRLLTFYDGDRGNFYRWRNISCDENLPCVNENDLDFKKYHIFYGFVRHVVANKHFGEIECISGTACYQPIFFRFQDVVSPQFTLDIERCIQPNNIIEFQICKNQYYSKSTNTMGVDASPETSLKLQAKNIRSWRRSCLVPTDLFNFEKHMKLLSNVKL